MQQERLDMQATTAGAGIGNTAQRQAITTAFEREWETLLVSARVAVTGARLTPSRADVQSAAHEVLSRAYVTAINISARYDVTRPPVPWLKGIIYNTARTMRNEMRSRNDREQPLPDTVDVDADTRTERELVERLRAASSPLDPDGSLRVNELLELVSSEDARLLRLAEVEREPAAEIAAQLGISTGNVYTRLHRARAHLRDSWIAAHRTLENDHA